MTWWLTCDLEVSPPAGHAARTVCGSAPIFSGVPLLLALLRPQEEKPIVRQQNSETRKQRGLNLPICKIFKLSQHVGSGCPVRDVFISEKVSFSIKWVTSRNAGTGDNQIVLFDAQRTRDRRQDQLLRLGHSWWQAETKHWHGLQQSGIQWNSNQIQP